MAEQEVYSPPYGFDFKKLSGTDNHFAWARNIEPLLTYEDVWEIVEGKLLCPTIWTEEKDEHGVVIRAGLTNAEISEFEQRYKDWNTKNRKAGAILMRYCNYRPASLIANEADAATRWLKLKDKYQPSGFIAMHIRVGELMTTTLTDCNGDVEKYIGRIRENSADLRDMGKPMPDWLLVKFLLNGLDANFSRFVHEILIIPDERAPEFDEVVNLLRREARQEKSWSEWQNRNKRSEKTKANWGKA